MGVGEDFIREAAVARGIDPQVAVDVANAEGGVDAPGKVGEFATGTSFWQLQLHYGGPDYPQYGIPGESVAGMGNDFSAYTGWPPGDPYAWRDAARRALNAAREHGWGAWYGAAAIGITGFDGIDTSVPWDPNGEPWDFETGAIPPMENEAVTTPAPVYNCLFPAFAQNDDWSCSCTAVRWSLWAYGREPTEQYVESSMLSQGIVTTQFGLMDATGGELAAWLRAEYGPAEYGGYDASNDPSVTFEDVAAEAVRLEHPLVMGGRTWCHWTGVRGADGNSLLLANPAVGWMGVGQRMSREQFQYLGPFSLVRLVHPSESGAAVPEPPAGDPCGPWRGTVGSGLLEMMAADGTRPAQRASTWLPLGASPADVEECYGENGVRYGWLLGPNAGYRYRPS